jgi:hypothetical protein
MMMDVSSRELECRACQVKSWSGGRRLGGAEEIRVGAARANGASANGREIFFQGEVKCTITVMCKTVRNHVRTDISNSL